MRSILPAYLLVFATAAAACSGDGVTSTTPQYPKGIVVLDGYIQPGLTLLGDTGTATVKLPFGPTTEFDGGGFSLERDTVLSVSSRAAGDLLYLADLRTSTVRKVQLPARSNPSKARLFKGTGGQPLIAAALRDSQSIALLALSTTGVASSSRIANAGSCPTDMFGYDNATWIVDANSACRTTYAVQGDVRLIRVPATGTTRDTLVLPGLRGSGASAIIAGDVAWISAGGDADFSKFPYTLKASGAMARVDLKNRRILSTRPMPDGSYGASLKLGLDGFLYASLYENLSTFTTRILKIRGDDLTFVTASGTTAAPWVALTAAGGGAASCSSAQADALGRIHCISNGAASATSLLVFSVSGLEVRRVAAGQGGVDLAIR